MQTVEQETLNAAIFQKLFYTIFKMQHFLLYIL